MPSSHCLFISGLEELLTFQETQISANNYPVCFTHICFSVVYISPETVVQEEDPLRLDN